MPLHPLDYSDVSAQLSFYAYMWLAPGKWFFRRPAIRFYGSVWTCFRSLTITTLLLQRLKLDIAFCVDVFLVMFPFAFLQPFVIYKTMLIESQWWCGTYSKTASAQMPGSISKPLMGFEIRLDSAMELAAKLDELTSHQKQQQFRMRLLNFGYLKLFQSELLGQGGTSRVYAGSFRGLPVAVKLLYVMDLTPTLIDSCCREALLLTKIANPNVVRMFGVAVLPPSLCLVLELCVRGDLQKFLVDANLVAKKLMPVIQMHLALGCARGMAALHRHGIVHKDVKASNFLLDEWLVPKVADLELSTIGFEDAATRAASAAEEGRTPTRIATGGGDEIHTLNWFAPEVITGGLAHADAASDVYSMGMIFYQILCGGVVPFEGHRDMQVTLSYSADVRGQGRSDQRRYPADVPKHILRPLAPHLRALQALLQA
jgi:tRNA A-37 threonylcarbamoyl transferase component Bud32